MIAPLLRELIAANTYSRQPEIAEALRAAGMPPEGRPAFGIAAIEPTVEGCYQPMASGHPCLITGAYENGALVDLVATHCRSLNSRTRRGVADMLGADWLDVAMAAWETRRDDALSKMTQAAKGNKDLTGAEADLAKIEGQKPDAPRIPRLLFEDVTPEKLGRALANEWPSAGIFSSEGGSILGSHAMGKDSLGRTLSLFNKLWSAESHTVDRAQAASFAVRGARLSMHIAVQPHLWADFLANDRGMSRGGGFIARLLIAAPASTQGTRLYREVGATPGLDAYTARIAELLSIVSPVDPERGLTPPVLEFRPDAKAVWERLYNAIEEQQKTTGDFVGVTDIASKAADNIARLAAIFHIVQHGPIGDIGPDLVNNAGQIILWHLYAAKAVLGPLALARDQANAVTLDRWLIDRCRAEGVTRFSTRVVLQGGPVPTRQKKALEAATRILAESGRARLVESGKRREIEINPALLADIEPEPGTEPAKEAA
jgi:putative DNA primase/helicase